MSSNPMPRISKVTGHSQVNAQNVTAQLSRLQLDAYPLESIYTMGSFQEDVDTFSGLLFKETSKQKDVIEDIIREVVDTVMEDLGELGPEGSLYPYAMDLDIDHAEPQLDPPEATTSTISIATDSTPKLKRTSKSPTKTIVPASKDAKELPDGAGSHLLINTIVTKVLTSSYERSD